MFSRVALPSTRRLLQRSVSDSPKWTRVGESKLNQLVADQYCEWKSTEQRKTDRLAIVNAHYARESLGIDLNRMNNQTVREVTDYTQAMFAAVQGDGVLHPEEEDWILGHLVSFGVPDNVIEKMVTENSTMEEVAPIFKANPRLAATKRMLAHHCIEACLAKGHINDDEIAATKVLADAIGMPHSDIDTLVGLAREERALRKKKLEFIWDKEHPEGETQSTFKSWQCQSSSE